MHTYACKVMNLQNTCKYIYLFQRGSSKEEYILSSLPTALQKTLIYDQKFFTLHTFQFTVHVCSLLSFCWSPSANLSPALPLCSPQPPPCDLIPAAPTSHTEPGPPFCARPASHSCSPLLPSILHVPQSWRPFPCTLSAALPPVTLTHTHEAPSAYEALPFCKTSQLKLILILQISWKRKQSLWKLSI